MHVRSLLWLIAIAAFLLPSFAGPVAASDLADHPAASPCAEHAPPPCPDEGTAQHAAGLCCPLMSGTPALLPPAAVTAPGAPGGSFGLLVTPPLTGLSPHKDPPPPRV